MSRALALAVVAVAHLLTSANATASVPLDPLPALKGDYFQLRSTTLERSFHIYVRLPEGYEKTGDNYPTVYLTDGDSLFPILGAYHLFLHYDEPVPEAIVVGIAYGTFDDKDGNYRSIDYTAPPSGGSAVSGAAAFQSFLKEELIPRIEKQYRSDPSRRILVGQSRGGQFVLYSAYTDPDLFWARIASNPSLGPNRAMFFQPARRGKRTDLKLFIAGGTRDARASKLDTQDWMKHWGGRHDTPWQIESRTMKGETHAAGITNVYRAGMLWIFSAPD